MSTLEITTPPVAARKNRHLPLPLVVGGCIILLWIIIAITAPWLAPYSPLDMVGRRLMPPSADHWLGTDALGRDVFSRTLYGAAQSLPIAAVVMFFGVSIGVVLGAIAGFVGGIVDSIIMRLADVTLSFPPILLAIAITSSLGPGLPNAAIAMVIVWWPIYARLMRAQVLAVRNLEHVDAAITSGVTQMRLLTKHILPLTWTPIIVNATMDFGQVVLLAASLSFVGLGALPPTPEWGSMISEGALHFYYWWIAAGPGLAIMSLVLSFNFIGDGVRDLLDPNAE
ncbi:ABC transporter permease [Agrobacterium sp. T29]|uniref:ABC transporter permease n=1 Tax=Agrobacterium sp. T29 TaxID=2580515 RepID=UPI00115E7110|nr:ABC transporter permease [Agrobacterium sp. T29]